MGSFLLYSVHEGIRGIPLDPADKSDALVPVSGTSLAVGIDFHAGNIYWTDQGFDVIEVARLNGSFRYVVISQGLDKPRAITWGQYPRIERSRLDGSQRLVIVNVSISWPNGISVDYEVLMFWTNWNEQSPSIMRASLNGANVLVIIGSDIKTPNGLAIDHRAEKLYFSDATLDKIERCEYDGSNRYVRRLFNSMSLVEKHDAALAPKHIDAFKIVSDIPQQPMGIVAVANDTNSCGFHSLHPFSQHDL
uniref:Uncharacterized protein n=1 Tax=Poecilia reticulata TaxID=8081 RepID=A0A3P9Q8V5_POERE